VDGHGTVFRTSLLTCTIDGLAHLVSDDAAAAGVVARRGTYAALCGHTVHAAALVSAAGRPCGRCAAHFEALRAAMDIAAGTRRTRRARRGARTRLQRLLARIQTLAPSGFPRPSLGGFGFSLQTAGTTKRLDRRKTM